jgi:ribonucleoside-diphosphate reductase alpha chain
LEGFVMIAIVSPTRRALPTGRSSTTEGAADAHVALQALQAYTFVSRYARFDQASQRRETWDEAVTRVEAMHLRRYPNVADEIRAAFALVRAQRVLGSQRALQFAGPLIEQSHARLYNCCASFCDRPRFFQEVFWLLLCGSGVGFSVQKHHVGRLPRLRQPSPGPGRTFVIENTIEGWADALGALLSSYFEDPMFPAYAGCRTRFDYRLLDDAVTVDQDRGTPPEGSRLRRALESVHGVLDACLQRGQQQLRPIDAYDLLMHVAEAALVGSRRSATICVFSADDEEMLTAKTGNWFHDHPQRAGSNNSCLLLRDRTTREQFQHVLQNTREFGEPGFIWADSTEYLVNPCCEIGLWPVDEETGASGWQFCNLAEINGAAVRTRADFLEAARAAAQIGTWQAGYTDFAYLGTVSERITRREALLGVSITGMMENPALLLDPEMQRDAAEVIKEANETMARRIGIRPAARTTCIKPAGTTSCLLGTSSGIHPHHARRYFRRVRTPKTEAALRHFAAHNPLAVEESVWTRDHSDVVLTFCVQGPASALTKQDLSALEFLQYVRGTQRNWVRAGARMECATQPWLTHNVSNTVVVRDDEWQDVGDFLYDRRDDFTGVSLLPVSGDKDYRQAPMCAVLTWPEIVSTYGTGWRSGLNLLVEAWIVYARDVWSACEHLQGRGHAGRQTSGRQRRWLRRARACARRCFGNNVRQLSNCLKDLANLEHWQKLTAAFQSVDYTEMVQGAHETHHVQEAACVAGACEV